MMIIKLLMLTLSTIVLILFIESIPAYKKAFKRKDYLAIFFIIVISIFVAAIIFMNFYNLIFFWYWLDKTKMIQLRKGCLAALFTLSLTLIG